MLRKPVLDVITGGRWPRMSAARCAKGVHTLLLRGWAAPGSVTPSKNFRVVERGVLYPETKGTLLLLMKAVKRRFYPNLGKVNVDQL